MGLFVSTTGSNVSIPELGIDITHPALWRQLDNQFSADEIASAESLTSYITSGVLLWSKKSSGDFLPGNTYDPDFLRIDQIREGFGTMTSVEIVTSSTPVILNVSSPTIIVLTGSFDGQIIRLPKSLNERLGLTFFIYNRSSYSVTVIYDDGDFFFNLPSGTRSELVLQDNSTSDGGWFVLESFNNIASGIVHYKITSQVLFSTNSSSYVPISDFLLTPIAGTYAVWFNARSQSSNGSAINNWVITKNTIPVSDTERGARYGASGTDYTITTMGTIELNGADTLSIDVKRSGGTLTIYDRSVILIRLGA